MTTTEIIELLPALYAAQFVMGLVFRSFIMLARWIRSVTP